MPATHEPVVARTRRPGRRVAIAIVISAASALAACSSSSGSPSSSSTGNSTLATATGAAPSIPISDPGASTPGGPMNIYAHTLAGDISPVLADAKSYVYVPSNDDGSVTVIDQATMKVVAHYAAGSLVQHVVPSYDLKTLYATASGSNNLLAIDPNTGKAEKSIPVDAPYNLYFTPDGKKAMVMAERRRRIDFYDLTTWRRVRSISTPCGGINHADFSPDETWFVATCEFTGEILKVDLKTFKIVNDLKLPAGAMPQDLRIMPDGSKFYVADMMHACVWILSADGTKVIGKIDTGVGAHGIYPSRDTKLVYVTNRGRLENDTHRKSRPGDGSISVVDPTTDKVIATWAIPGGGSPDMGGVSADGSTLWLSGRYDSVVYAFDTTTGKLKAKISVPSGPHGLCVYPQPGRYSLGHTGIFR